MEKINIGVIVHGPGIVDTGYARKIIELLANYGNVSCKLGGTMGRTAVIDAKLEDVIDIKEKLLPSQSIKKLSESNDILFLLNYGKSTITGHTFGYKVYNNAGDVKLVQIERPGEDDASIIIWKENEYHELIDEISKKLAIPISSSEDASKIVKDLTGYDTQNSTIKRKVAGVSPGENIMLNGIIIGKVTDNELTIIAEDNKITRMIGGNIKEHGLEKLGRIDLDSAIIKTGLLRKAENIIPRSIEHVQNKNLKAVLLNHAAEDIYKYKDADILVSIGDDTTLLSSDILYRFNVPIIGITDGDLDKVVEEGFKLDDSMIIQLESGYDDIIGNKIYEDLFKKDNCIIIESIEEFKKEIISIIDAYGIEYHFVEKQLS